MPKSIRVQVFDAEIPVLIMISKIESVQDLGKLRFIRLTSGRKMATELSLDEIEALINGEIDGRMG